MIYVVADHHFCQPSMLSFRRADGSPFRTKKGVEFTSMQDHDEYLVAQHNSVVTPQDRVYFLGDFCMDGRYLDILRSMNGRKNLVAGNHDIYDTDKYLKAGFQKVSGSRVFTPKDLGHYCILTHIPVHPNSLMTWRVNVHGHTHSAFVTTNDVLDPRYIPVSMEHLDDYKPVNLLTLLEAYNA